MHTKPHGTRLLAEQSIYAQLVIENRPAIVTKQQEKNDSFYNTYLAKDAATNVLVTNYSITNLPNTILTLPTNSIFDRILFIAKTWPDFRLIPIDGNGASQTNNCATITTTTFDPTEKLNMLNVYSGVSSGKIPLFVDSVPLKPPSTEAKDSACMSRSSNIYEDLFGNPATLQSSEVSPELMNSIRSILASAPPRVDPPEESDVLRAIFQHMNIDGNLVYSQLQSGNPPANYDTVRLGLLLNIRRTLGDSFLPHMNDNTVTRMVNTISDYVKARLAQGR